MTESLDFGKMVKTFHVRVCEMNRRTLNLIDTNLSQSPHLPHLSLTHLLIIIIHLQSSLQFSQSSTLTTTIEILIHIECCKYLFIFFVTPLLSAIDHSDQQGKKDSLKKNKTNVVQQRKSRIRTSRFRPYSQQGECTHHRRMECSRGCSAEICSLNFCPFEQLLRKKQSSLKL